MAKHQISKNQNHLRAPSSIAAVLGIAILVTLAAVLALRTPRQIGMDGKRRAADRHTGLQAAMKRALDILASALGLIVLSPLMLALALAVRLSSPGPVFYRANRIGRDGKPFKLYKFRSMVVGADRRGPGITSANDSRITPIGKFLRATKLDELPQLLNVLRGEMSLVGPRPEDPRYVALYTPEQRTVLSVRPGITSLASVRYRDEAALLVGPNWEARYVNQIMPKKLAFDLEYTRQANLLADLKILSQTFHALWR